MVQWRIAYLLSVAMSLDDDTCQSLIEAVKFVFADCGITFYQPPHKHHFGSVEDFNIHAEEIWNDIRSKARSQSRTARLYFSVVAFLPFLSSIPFRFVPYPPLLSPFFPCPPASYYLSSPDLPSSSPFISSLPLFPGSLSSLTRYLLSPTLPRQNVPMTVTGS